MPQSFCLYSLFSCMKECLDPNSEPSSLDTSREISDNEEVLYIRSEKGKGPESITESVWGVLHETSLLPR